MKNLFLLLLAISLNAIDLENLHSFEADFTQTITNDKNTTITYKGHMQASKPQFAIWHYIFPVEKSIYISNAEAVIIEPELEQAYVQKIDLDFDFFHIIKEAKKIEKDTFITEFQNTKYTLKVINNKLVSIIYKNELDNSVKIIFSNQQKNKRYKEIDFTPNIPTEYDIIRG